MSKRRSQVEWRKLIIARENSGLTVKQWCKQNQISKATYYYWFKKINTLSKTTQEEPCFAEIIVKEEPKQKSSTMLLTYKGFSLEISEEINQAWLADILKMLPTLC